VEVSVHEVAEVLIQLLPGFLTAWIFYSLTAHARPSPFERVVQALIFTMLVQALVIIVRYALYFAGRWISIGPWNSDIRLLWSIILACVLGLVSSRLTNNDGLHKALRRYGWTMRTSAPSEWYSAFSTFEPWVILNLSGGRRLFGWAEQWPDRPDRGHFIIEEPEWLLPNGSRAPLPWLDILLLPASEVEFVEFLKRRGDVDDAAEDALRARAVLIAAQETTQGNEVSSDHESNATTPAREKGI
jgi:hypothetical protein